MHERPATDMERNPESLNPAQAKENMISKNNLADWKNSLIGKLFPWLCLKTHFSWFPWLKKLWNFSLISGNPVGCSGGKDATPFQFQTRDIQYTTKH